MLFQPTPEPPNPHAPFVYRGGEIRLTGDLGDRYEADVWESRAGWRWSARSGAYPVDAATLGGEEGVEPAWTDAPGGRADAEEQAVAEAVAWLRSRCVALHGSCG